MPDFIVRPLDNTDKDWVAQFVTEHWGTEFIVAHGEIYHPRDLPGFTATEGTEKVGLVTYTLEEDACEIVSLDSLRPSIGIGAALISSVKAVAQQNHCRRLWLTTTNDNLNALRFYQKQGFVLTKIHRNAVEIARQYKPIPRIGMDGIPVRDEIELELVLKDAD